MSDTFQPEPSDSSDSRGPLLLVGLVSAIAIVFLFWLIYFKSKAVTHDAWIDYLPWLNGVFNASAALCLVRGYLCVKRKQIAQHRLSMLAAFGCSTLFLLSYIVYHAVHAESHFPGEGLVRYVYFFTLISHVSLSIVSLPLVLSSLFLGLTSRFTLHRKVARWTFPLWLYVSVTGVFIVMFLKSYGA